MRSSLETQLRRKAEERMGKERVIWAEVMKKLVEGKSKRFLYELPLKKQQGDCMADKKKILIIEDEPHILKLVRFILESNGYAVIEAYIGAEGVEKARKEMPDLIVLDVMMPNLDGFQVAEMLTKDKTTKHIPILMLSSKAQFEDKMKGIDSGATDYITKPFEKEELLQKVKECLEGD